MRSGWLSCAACDHTLTSRLTATVSQASGNHSHTPRKPSGTSVPRGPIPINSPSSVIMILMLSTTRAA